MKEKKLTTAAGIPVSDNQNSLTAGQRGPTLMQDHVLLDKLRISIVSVSPKELFTQKPQVHTEHLLSPMI